jgi:hypothetical protein
MMNSVEAFGKKYFSKMFLKSYSHDSPQDTKVRKVVLDVLQLDFSSP